ncbi:MAG: deoxyribonuclease HsdR [Marinilabiliales bacterium]|nr:MAG: deoxyribonuclease HsdR [Marinilabiliales bacterium]
MKRKSVLLSLLFGFSGALLAMGALYAGLRLTGSQTTEKELPKINNRAPVYQTAHTSSAPEFTSAAELSVPAVVHIKTTFQRKNAYYDDFFSPFYEFFNMPNRGNNGSVMGAGSGVIISDDGYIVTNNHVVNGADKVSVTLNDKRVYDATIVGTDPSTDLALIKIEEKELPYLVFANSDEVLVGEWVLAVGNPFNLTSTVTAGIVSAKARDINILGGGTSVESFIQTDAAVNPGNSGGALVNTQGELIGINAAIASNTGSYAGYSFAIPSNIARKVVLDLMNYGVVQRAYLGLTVAEVDGALAKEYGLESVEGLYITEIVPKGAAYEAGIDAGDIILSINGEKVNQNSRLNEIVAEHSPGDKLKIEIKRGKKIMIKTVELQNRRGETKLMDPNDNNIISYLGATFEDPSQSELQRLRLEHGLKIVELQEGALKNAGVQNGFIVTSINHQPIYSSADIENALAGKSGGVLIEGVYPNGMKAYYGFGI